MRLYFRHARSVERRLTQMLELVPAKQPRELLQAFLGSLGLVRRA